VRRRTSGVEADALGKPPQKKPRGRPGSMRDLGESHRDKSVGLGPVPHEVLFRACTAMVWYRISHDILV
jgi:hypothetical protein